MAIQEMEIDPGAGGVSAATFDGHTHNYRKLDEVAVSVDHLYNTVLRYSVTDDAETVAIVGNNSDLEAVGVTVATEPTSTPV